MFFQENTRPVCKLKHSKIMIFFYFRSPGSSRDETDFQEGFRLETVDIYNPKILRVSSIAAVEVGGYI